jgi:predicted outer membrane repeat protein
MFTRPYMCIGGSTRTSGGAVISSTDSLANISHCLFANNSASYGGGGILNGGKLNVFNTSFTGHMTGSVGSVISTAREAVTTFIDCVFANNKAGIPIHTIHSCSVL